MALWIELHCDNKDSFDSHCWTLKGDSVGALVSGRAGLAGGLRYVEAQAKHQRWRRVRNVGWLCPGCQGLKRRIATRAEVEASLGRTLKVLSNTKIVK